MSQICKVNKLPTDIILYLSKWLIAIDYFNLSQVSSFYRNIIINHNLYWLNKIKKINILNINYSELKPFYYFLYCFRFINFNIKKSYLNSVFLENKKWVLSNDLNSISKNPIILLSSSKSFDILVKTKIKISGYYKIILIIKIFSNSFLNDLHLILNNDNKIVNKNDIGLINSINFPSEKKNNLNLFQLSKVSSKKNYVHNIFSIYDQHKIRNKGWNQLMTSSIYLNDNSILSINIFNKKGIFYRYSLDGIYLIKSI